MPASSLSPRSGDYEAAGRGGAAHTSQVSVPLGYVDSCVRGLPRCLMSLPISLRQKVPGSSHRGPHARSSQMNSLWVDLGTCTQEPALERYVVESAMANFSSDRPRAPLPTKERKDKHNNSNRPQNEKPKDKRQHTAGIVCGRRILVGPNS